MLIPLAGTTAQLLPEKAMFLPELNALLIADAHFGKAQAYRRLGVPVPEATTQGNLATLTRLMATHTVKQLIFLGDLLHSAAALVPQVLLPLQDWRAQHAGLEMLLVDGNHDLRAFKQSAAPFDALEIRRVEQPYPLGPFALAHEPIHAQGLYTLCGHLHPRVHLRSRRDALALPCFWLQPACGVLPAFGEFTGGHPIRATPQDRVYAIASERVYAV